MALCILCLVSSQITVVDGKKPLLLSASDLTELTRRERPTAQARVLQRLGIPFKIHPSDGVLLVTKDAVIAVLGGAATQDAVPEFEVNVQAIRERYGRRRRHLEREQPLPPGLYRHGRQYRARRGRSEAWTYFGPDYVAAMASFAAWRRDGPTVDTVAWLLDLFAGTICAGYVKAGRISPRTALDYARDKEPLKAGLGHIPIKRLTSRHVAEYRDARAQDTSHIRQELGCLSAAMSYAVEAGHIPLNPCRGVRKPRRVRRERFISDDEYLKVYAVAGVAVRVAMVLAIRTLALPADLLGMGPRNLIRLAEGQRALRFARGKTGRLIEIELVGELAALVDQHLAADVVYPTFVHRRDGKRFTVDGIGAMFRRYCSPDKANVQDFGLRDLRAKGATDMVRRGIDIRRVQHLLGHASVRTTEIYIKGLLPTTVRPNETPIIASVK